MTPEQLQRFEKYVHIEPNTACWLWVGAQTSAGYGELVIGSKRGPGPRMGYAHRLSYEHYIGPIPKGLQLDHLCRQRCCCNPAHLEPVTHAENMARCDKVACGRLNRSKTHCLRGHTFDERNTFVRSTGARRCRACERDAATRRRKNRLGLNMPGEPIPVEDEGSDDKEAAE